MNKKMCKKGKENCVFFGGLQGFFLQMLKNRQVYEEKKLKKFFEL